MSQLLSNSLLSSSSIGIYFFIIALTSSKLGLYASASYKPSFKYFLSLNLAQLPAASLSFCFLSIQFLYNVSIYNQSNSALFFSIAEPKNFPLPCLKSASGVSARKNFVASVKFLTIQYLRNHIGNSTSSSLSQSQSSSSSYLSSLSSFKLFSFSK
ncbi:hypothetical protein ABPG74_020259 [Tetrahymena malaccensis]